MKFLLLPLLLLPFFCTSVRAQTCDLGTQDWESGTNANPPDGWTRIGGPNQDNVNFGEADGRAVGLNALGEGIASPELTCLGTVTYEWHSSGQDNEFTVELQWTQTPGDDNSWQTFSTVEAVNGGGPAQTQYMEVVADLPEETAVAPFGITVRWIMTARSTGGALYIDNICFESGTCTVQPTRISFTQLPVTCIEVGAPFTVVACATDDNGFVAESFAGDILVLPSGGTVSGGGNNPATDGCVQLNLTANTAGSFDLLGSSAGLAADNVSLMAEAQCPNEIDVRVMAYNLLNFPDGRDQCDNANDIVLPNRQDTLAKIIDFVRPDVLMVCELKNAQGSQDIVTALKGVDPAYEAAMFVENTSSDVKNLNNMLYYNSAKMTLVSQSVIPTGTRDISRYRMQMNDPRIATAPDTVFVDFFVAHTKAGSAPGDSTRRANDIIDFQTAFDALPVDNAVFGGDLNFYTSTEGAYQALLNGANPWFDPVDAPGEWDNNVAFTDLHTQSSRECGSQSYDCGIFGGMDSRFDFLLYNGPIMSESMGVEYLDGTYEVPGNDGNLFNESINAPSNMSTAPRSVLDALFFMSDHLPVTMDMRVTFPLQSLPVGLVEFSAAAGAKQVELQWKVGTETGFSHYEVERLTGSENWTTLGRVAGGFSDYEFTDIDPAQGTNIYRLRMVDLDGSEGFSSVESVRFGAEVALYPTVTDGEVYVRGTLTEDLQVFDGLGRSVLTLPAEADRFSLAGLPSGWYTVVAGKTVARVFRR